jgi:phage gp29-like protein
MRPDPMTDEKGFQGLVYDITDAMLNGLAMSEIMWWEDPDTGEILPRASAWVHPRHFTFGNDGKLAVFDDMYNRLQFPLAQSPGQPPSRDKFIIAQFMSRSGSSLGAGLMRPLAWDWSAVVFNREWMLEFAQRYGNPFLDAAYAPGTTNDEIEKLNKFLNTAGPQGWISHVDTATINVHPAQSLGADSPQVRIMQMADDHCMLLLLGQTATTQGTPGKLGNDDSRDQVKLEIVQSVAGWVAQTLTEQLARSVTRLNYGDEQELPLVEADFTEETDPMVEAQRYQIFISAGLPLDAEEVYKQNNLKMPQEGDKVVIGGQIGTMGNTDGEIGGITDEPEEGYDQFGNPLPDFGGPDDNEEDEEPEEEEEEEPTDARGFSRSKLRRVLAKASDAELAELRGLLVQAAGDRKPNGKWEAVKIKVNKIQRKAVVRGRSPRARRMKT